MMATKLYSTKNSRLSRVLSLPIKSGSHAPPNGEFNGCVMECVAYVAGEEWSDKPKCVCPVIGAFLRTWNDGLPNDAERTRLLQPLIMKVMDTKATKEVEFARAMLCVDWFIREFAPAWLDLVPSLKTHADFLRAAKPIQSYDDLSLVKEPLRAAKKDADAAESAAWSAAKSAAESAVKQTADSLQHSALSLVERMCAVKEPT